MDIRYSEPLTPTIHCENCHRMIPEYMEKYCIDCGQRILWEEDRKMAKTMRRNLKIVNTRLRDK